MIEWVEMMVKTDLSGLKAMAAKGELTDASQGHAEKYAYTPMLMPVATGGKEVMKVGTRQEYLNQEIGNWRNININRALGVIAGLAALYLLSVNVLLAGAAALYAGWAWGAKARDEFFLYKIAKKRELLEGT